MQIHELKPKHKNKAKKRIGRGVTRGKTSGRGHKGQKARAGAKMRPATRDTIKSIPKRRGYGVHRSQSVVSMPKPVGINVCKIQNTFENDDIITPSSLAQKGLISKKGGKLPQVKILGSGEIKKKVKVSNCFVSTSAREKIEKAGGNIF